MNQKTTSIKKYWVFFVQNVNEYLTYRLKLFLGLFSNLIIPITMIWIFSSLPQSQFAGMTKAEIAKYYVLGSFLYQFVGSKADDFIKLAIQHGDLGRYLIKPVNFWLLVFIHDFSKRIIRFFISIPFLIIFASLVGVPLDFLRDLLSIQTLCILILSYSLIFFMSFSLGLLTFWVEEVWGLQNLKETGVKILSGLAIHYQFFPVVAVSVLQWLPFPYLIIWIVRFGFTGNIYFEIFVAIFWITTFYLLSLFLWRRGLKAYSGTGLY